MPNEHIEKLKSVAKGKIAVFVDAANLEQSVRDMWVNPKDIPEDLKHFSTDQLRWSVDYKKLKEFFKSIGVVEMIRFYSADFQTESHRGFMYFLRKGLKFTLVTKPLKEYDDHTPEDPHRKANFDVEIGIDSTFYMNKFDTLILFSGDSDFEYLLKFMRGHGKVALVFSRSGHVAKELPPAASHYFDIVDFRLEILNIQAKKAKNPAG
ncbi:MAG TPA: NYN domain-containing protein [Candidatus Paceibacterota bacterium]|nr:NYN domain-containing protein [Candidatus Paceibacterota bacterium]